MSEKIKVSRSKIEELYSMFSSLKEKKFTDKYFSFFIIKNISNLQSEVTSLADLRKTVIPSQKWIDYNSKRESLLTKYTLKNEDGTNAIEIQGSNTIIRFVDEESKRLFDYESSTLHETYKDAINEYEAMVTSFLNVFNEEIEQDIMKISFKGLPDDFAIDENIKLFIKESDEEIEKILENKYS